MPHDDISRRQRELECYLKCVTLPEMENEVSRGRVSEDLRDILDCPECGMPYHLCTCDEDFTADELGIDPESY